MKKKGLILLLLLLISFVSTFNVYSFSERDIKEYKMIENILLIGLDGTNDKFPKRSDTMIILTIDKLNKSLKLTSLARDTLVKIPGRGEEKLTHAYAYGQEELLMQTINENFDLDIKDYAVVNFKSFIDIVDIIGGVDINVNEKEIHHLNEVIKECYGVNHEDTKNIEYITSSGNHNLNGYQALAYARIRKLDTIYKRDERQRLILTNIAHKLSDVSISKYLQIAKSILRHIKVNIAFNKIIDLAFIAHELASYDISQLEFPISEYREEGRIGEKGTYVVKWDKNKNIEFRVNIEPTADLTFLDDIDKIGILGNLLDNAMEAAGKCRDNKSVALDIYTSNNNHFIVLNIQNTSETAPLKKGTRFLSTKKNQENHGIGLEYVKNVVAKYQGFLNIKYEDGVYYVRVIIPKYKR